MGNQHNILSNKLIDAGKDKTLPKEVVKKASKDVEALKKKLSDYKAKKADVTGNLKMPTSELSTAKAYMERMNTGSKKFDDILCTQKLPFDKCGLGFTDSTSTSKNLGMSLLKDQLRILLPRLLQL